MKDMEKALYQKYGAYLRNKRKKAELSIKELSPQIGIGISYLSDFERGRSKIALSYFFEALRKLGVKQIDLGELYGETLEPVPAPDVDPEKAKMKKLLQEVLAEGLK
jgi:transcriptional regulator with XRE-family HTH domain